MSQRDHRRQELLAEGRALVRPENILELVRVMVDTPSPPGEERPLAERLVELGACRHPALRWDLDLVTDTSASLVSRSQLGPRTGRELGFYAHLDAGYSGADIGPEGALTFDEPSGRLRGPGLCVAKGPCAAATVGYWAAAEALRAAEVPHRSVLMLTAGGTHRAPPRRGRFGQEPWTSGFGGGVHHLLHRGLRPTAVINAKAGAPGILHEEPGSLFLHLQLRTEGTPVIQKRTHDRQTGAVGRAGELVLAIDDWRSSFLARDDASSQLAREVVVGALAGGLAHKPDAPTTVLDAYVYVVTGLGDDVSSLADGLAATVQKRLDDAGGKRVDVDVEPYAFVCAGRTDPSVSIVQTTHDVLTRRRGEVPVISGWKGSTDGAIFRQVGIDTVRLGPSLNRDDDDPRLETLSLDELVEMAEIYCEIAIRYLSEAAESL